MRGLPSSDVRPARHDVRRRGAALMVVMIVVAVATVLGFAMVSASALQSQTAGNLRYVTTAEYLADSGAQLAYYYLQYPSASPVAMPNGYYPGQTGVSFGSSVAGTADVSVSYDSAADRYTITSVGKASTPGGTTVNKRVTATIAVLRQFRQTTAVTAPYSIRLTALTTVTGGLQTNGTLTAVTGSSLTTLARYRSISASTAAVPSGIRSPLSASETVAAPTLSTIKDYTGTYTYQGHTYAAQKLTDTTLSNVTLPTPSDAITNPAGIYWTDQNVTLNGGFKLNGTLIITNGYLRIGSLLLAQNTITPKDGFPALVVQSDIDVSGVALLGIGVTLTANGLVWTGGGLKTGALLSSTTINGAFLSAGNAPIDTGYKGSININYDASKCNIPDFSTVNTVNVGLRIVSWTVS